MQEDAIVSHAYLRRLDKQSIFRRVNKKNNLYSLLYEGPDKDAWMRWLICAFAARICPKTRLVMTWPVSWRIFHSFVYCLFNAT